MSLSQAYGLVCKYCIHCLPFTGIVHKLIGDFVVESAELLFFCTESMLSPGVTHELCVTDGCLSSGVCTSSFSSIIGAVLLFFFNSADTFHLLLFIPSDCKGLRRMPKGFLPSKCPFPSNSLLLVA